MARIVWTEAMSVGVPELDADHRVLIGVINQIETGAEAETHREVIRKCLVQLMRYAEFHFAREENVMEACHFPGLDGHKDEHNDFVETVQGMAERFETDPDGVVDDKLLDFLKNWLKHHILIQDMAYRPYAEGDAHATQAAQSFRALDVWWSR